MAAPCSRHSVGLGNRLRALACFLTREHPELLEENGTEINVQVQTVLVSSDRRCLSMDVGLLINPSELCLCLEESEAQLG